MINRISRPGNGLALRDPRPGFAPFRDLLGLDPFRDLLSTWNVDYGVSRTEAGYEVEVPVPGYKPEEIDISYQDGMVTISGKSDRRSFSRSLTLPEDVDEDRIQARVENGMLRLDLARVPEAQPKKISISSG